MEKSKQALRRRIAAAPIPEKLRMLDAMRERSLAIRRATRRDSVTIQETPGQYQRKTGRQEDLMSRFSHPICDF